MGRIKTRISRRNFGRRVLAGAAVTASSLAAPAVRAARPRVVVIGGGAGGATMAHNLAEGSREISVVLVNPTATYTTCFFSNLYLGGVRRLESITHDYGKLARDYAIELAVDRAISLDADRRSVRLASGTNLSYDKLVVAPGIGLVADAIEGYGDDAAETMPHAWQKGEQAFLLKHQLLAMEDGGTFVICPPPNPYRCPPAPYERVSMIAQYFKAHKPRSKIVILDAKDRFTKQGLFEVAWARFYPDMIEWLPAEFTGGVMAVDPRSRTIMTEDEVFEASVASVIPPQRAGEFARAAGLADQSGWCPVAPLSFASSLVPDIHVLGDAAIAGEMPKSAYAANSQAKLCAGALLRELASVEGPVPSLGNACYSFVARDHGVKVGASYEATTAGIVKTEGFISADQEDDEIRQGTAREAEAWYDQITEQMFG